MSEKTQDYSYLDQIAPQKEKWNQLNKSELQVMCFRTFLLYGQSQNKNMILTIFEMYEFLSTQTTTTERTKMLTALSANIRKKQPKSIMALFPFIQVEEDANIIRTASQFFVNLSIISNKEAVSGAKILLELIKNDLNDARSAYILLGLLDMDNDKVNAQVSLIYSQLGSEVKTILHNNGVKI
ncbi:hypothetical protein EO244_05150 [Ancylomarina salipaludis]|uniref:HEAT repeat domain-containing protein n=1 Tax=Ancylomarina salipaludis TaxID=2501299 RepID=A0A4Q1JNM5_9BACT|nr:hypothetical protein [Ancylomarina salipaludis]RXQ96221.1 hypothetical protein EO244_05150 [Ancylomarina salipaludis]